MKQRLLKLLPFGIITLVFCLMSGCGSCSGDQESRDREPLSLIPADAWIVASIEMGAVRAAPAYKRALRQGNPTAYYLGNDCIYDPLPDIDRFWVGAGDEFERGLGAVIVFGPVNQEKALDCFRANMRRRGLSVEEETMEGFTVHTPGPGRPHVAWLDSKTLVVADRANMEKVLALEKGKGKSVRTNQALLKLWERASQGRDIALAVEPPASAAKRLGNIVPNSYSGLGTAEQALVGLRFSKGLDILVSARLKGHDETNALHKALTRDIDRWKDHDLVVIAGLSGHLNAIRLEAAGPELTASAHMTQRQVDTLVRFAVDSVDEIMRDSDPEEAIRRRLRGEGDGGPDADASVDGGAQDEAATEGGDSSTSAPGRDTAPAPTSATTGSGR